MKNILWIPYCVPYDGIPHAGGKCCNQDVKGFQKSGNFNIFVIAFYNTEEVDKIDLDRYGIKHELIELSNGFVKRSFRRILNLESTFNPWNISAGLLPNYQRNCLKNAVQKIAFQIPMPDFVFLQWTEVALLAPYIRELFPSCKLIIIEEDVAFLGYKRKADFCDNLILKYFAKIRYSHLRTLELDALNLSDLVVVNNQKDLSLLEENGVDKKKIFCKVPYFKKNDNLRWKSDRKTIIFFGAMYRKENYISAIWFIKNVFSKIEKLDLEFVVIGGNPPARLREMATSNIKILGFVENVDSYFENCLCLVAPLVLGAGIKVKILEAFAAGIPVLTNQIGIEGIPAKNGIDYLHCETAKEYMKAIDNLLRFEELGNTLSYNARRLVTENFDNEKNLRDWICKVNEL